MQQFDASLTQPSDASLTQPSDTLLIQPSDALLAQQYNDLRFTLPSNSALAFTLSTTKTDSDQAIDPVSIFVRNAGKAYSLACP